MAWQRISVTSSTVFEDASGNLVSRFLVSGFGSRIPLGLDFRTWWVAPGMTSQIPMEWLPSKWAGGGSPGAYVTGHIDFTDVYVPNVGCYVDVLYDFHRNMSVVPGYEAWGRATLQFRRTNVDDVGPVKVVEAAVPSPNLDYSSPAASVYLIPSVQYALAGDTAAWYRTDTAVIGQGGEPGYQVEGLSGVVFGGGGAAHEANGGDGVGLAAGGKADTTTSYQAGANGTATAEVPDFDASISGGTPTMTFRGGGNFLNMGSSNRVQACLGYFVIEYNVLYAQSATVTAAVPRPTTQVTAKVNVKTVTGMVEALPFRPGVETLAKVIRKGQVSARPARPMVDATATAYTTAQVSAKVPQPVVLATGTVKVPVRAQVMAITPRPIVSATATTKKDAHIVAIAPRPTVNANAARVIAGQADVGPPPPRTLATLWIEVHAPGYQSDPWERLPWDRR